MTDKQTVGEVKSDLAIARLATMKPVTEIAAGLGGFHGDDADNPGRANRFDLGGVDVIVGGHSHTLLGDMEGASGPYPTMVGDTAIVSGCGYGTEIAVNATRQAVQIHGGNGVTREFIVERLAREAIIGPIPDGTTEIQKLLIARSLTGVAAFK